MLNISELAFGFQIKEKRLIQAIEPLILEGTLDAPSEEGDDAIAEVFLFTTLQMAKVLRNDGSLLISAEVLPYLLLRTDSFHLSSGSN